MSEENVELVRHAFGVVTIPGDPEVLIAASGPGFEMHLTGVVGEPVHYAGEAGIRQFFRDVAQTWESFRFEATDVRDAGDRVLVLGDVRGRGRASGVEVDDRWGWVVECADGLAVSVHGFLDRGDAVRAVEGVG